MDALHIFLIIALILSLAANAFQWHKWHSYRTKSAGAHSHTAMIPKITATQVARDQKQNPSTGIMKAPRPLPQVKPPQKEE